MKMKGNSMIKSMKLSEFIIKLQNVQKEVGESEVIISTDKDSEDFNTAKVSIKPRLYYNILEIDLSRM